MMWQSSLPAVCTIAEWPPLVTDRKWCGADAALIASTAIFTSPLVPFLKPTGHESPDASSRCTWLSVVRAPIAPHAIRSARYCGVIMSRYSVPAGEVELVDLDEDAPREAQALVDPVAVVEHAGR